MLTSKLKVEKLHMSFSIKVMDIGGIILEESMVVSFFNSNHALNCAEIVSPSDQWDGFNDLGRVSFYVCKDSEVDHFQVS